MNNNELIVKVYTHIKENNISNVGFGGFTFNDVITLKLLTEGLIRTYPTETTVNYLKRHIGYDRPVVDRLINVTKDENGDGDIIYIYVIKNIGNYGIIMSKIDKAMTLCGWEFSKKESLVVDNIEYEILQYIPKFKDNTVDVSRFEMLYHLSPESYFKKIMSQGMCPKSSNDMFSYSPRVYCLCGNVSAKEIINLTLSLETVNNKDNNYYVLFGIDTSKLPDNIKFYNDQLLKNSVYTHDNIPPTALTVIKKFDITNLKLE